MPKRKIILLVIAGIVALGTMLAARSMMSTNAPLQQAPVVEAAQVMAAARDLPTGTILKETDLKWIPWAAESEATKLYFKGKADTTNLAGAVLRQALHVDEPLMVGQVVPAHEQGFLAAVLNPGMRAISIMLTPSAEVAGFIFPGDRVDVILTHSFSRKDVSDLTERRVSETVAMDVRVLALDQKSDDLAPEPKVAQLATLEVTPKQAEKLALAADLVGTGVNGRGTLSLALRSLATQENTELVGTKSPTWDSDVSQAYPNVNGDDGLMQRVQIMRGKETTETNFERHR